MIKPGDILNERYRIEEIIARGGMGSVYRATDLVLNVSVALKENMLNNEGFNRQFRLEAKLLAGLAHPNLPRVTDHFASGVENLYLVMDYIQGNDLRERIEREGLIAEMEVLQIGIAICGALSYLHTRQPAIVHRDIKPGNIKITPSGQYFLVDFGLAKLDQGGKTSTGAQAYTPGFSPPEQYGQGTEQRSDIYSLGATMYAALTGKVPQDGLERAMGNCELTPIQHHSPIVTLATIRAVEKAMSVQVEDRYASAQDFLTALSQSLHSLTSASQPVRPTQVKAVPTASAPTILFSPAVPHPPRQAAPKRSNLPLILAAGALLVSAVGIGAFFALSALRQPEAVVPSLAPQPTLPAALPADTATVPAPTAQPTQTASPAPQATRPPTQTPSPVPITPATSAPTPMGGLPGQLAFASLRSGTPQIWLTSLTNPNARQITDLPDGACQPDWSPDGSTIVFVSPCSTRQNEYPGASLYLIHADGTGLVPLVTLPGGDFDPAWSPDGTTIAFTSLRDNRANIYLYDLASSTVKRISSRVNIERRPAWSPDGKLIAYETRRNGPVQIWTMAADGSHMREFSKLEGGNSFMPTWGEANPAAAGKGWLLVYSQGNDQPFLTGQEFNNPTSGEFHLSEKIRGAIDPRFSPDNWWLAFTQLDPAGTSSLAIVSRNGSNLSQIPGTVAGDFHPSWRPAPK